MLLISLQVLPSQHLIYSGEHRMTIYQMPLLSTCCRCFVFFFFFFSEQQCGNLWLLFFVYCGPLKVCVFSHWLHGSQVLFILYVSWRNQINDASLAREKAFAESTQRQVIYKMQIFFPLILKKETVEVKRSEQRIGAQVLSLQCERDVAKPLMRFSHFPLERWCWI